MFLQVVAFSLLVFGTAPPVVPDERPAGATEWGFRPREGETCAADPPAFVVRPQKGAEKYEFVLSRDRSFKRVEYRAEASLPCHCPPKVLEPGTWYWRFRFMRSGRWSSYGRVRTFQLPQGALRFPMPTRAELLRRVPKEHPRLFVRPEDLPGLRRFAAGAGRSAWQRLVKEAEAVLRNPPSTEEPPLYPPGVKPLSDRWRRIWWGNRVRTIKVLGSAATLGFVWRISGDRRYGRAGKRLLLEAARWDPKGSTGYRYNDEAGMPYAYHFSRAYTFLYPLLSESERARCRAVMRERGREMYRHLCPRHLWRPYSSHSNRAWHFLGEVGTAFLNEIPEASDWLYFAVTVFFHCYPVWSDDDGGWHEGLSYYRSYLYRFTWWADVMRAALGIDAYRKPFFKKTGYFPMYIQVPGAEGGGFGDLSSRVRSKDTAALMSILAQQARNPHWQWYVKVHGGAAPEGGFIGFLRSSRRPIPARPPTDLSTSRLFAGVGIVAMNTTLLDSRRNVSVLFKSSPFGSQSHGYESQNAFLLRAFGQRMLIRSGERDIHGSKFHRLWMWQTKSVNVLTFEDWSQIPHSALSRGRIVGFKDTAAATYACGEAAEAYGKKRVRTCRRHLVFLKGAALVIWDRVRLARPKRVTFHLHAPVAFRERIPGLAYEVSRERGVCSVWFLWPEKPRIRITDRFDVQPRPYLKLHQWHLQAESPVRSSAYDLVTLCLIRQRSDPPSRPPGVQVDSTGTTVRFATRSGDWLVSLATGKGVEGLPLVLVRFRKPGHSTQVVLRVRAEESLR